MTRKRTLARELAVKLLYQYDVRARIEGMAFELDIDGFLTESSGDPEVQQFARRLYTGALEMVESSDRLLSEVVDNWKPERIAAIDRAILRLAIFELVELSDVPPKVVINEAIELAKKFSTAQSGAFVNGILDRLMVLRNSACSTEKAGEEEKINRQERQDDAKKKRRVKG